jgi:hypothetical protein|eukprot:COSAG03_NODE_6636_length_1026_cov_2711.653722_2_plen_97_part_00
MPLCLCSLLADAAAPLYYPGAASAALRNHSGVKFLVYRVDSPEDISDPIPIIFKLTLSVAKPTLRTSNPAHPSQKLSRKCVPHRARRGAAHSSAFR